MNGGKLIQDVTNHSLLNTHPIIDTETDKVYEITSTHHQMQYPFDLPRTDYTCLFKAFDRSDYYKGDSIKYPPYEPEIVLYHKLNFPKCLAIQGHPEYMQKKSPIIIRLNDIINDLLTDEN